MPRLGQSLVRLLKLWAVVGWNSGNGGDNDDEGNGMVAMKTVVAME